MISLKKRSNKIFIKTEKYRLTIDFTLGSACLKTSQGKSLFIFPLDIRMEIRENTYSQVSSPFRIKKTENELTLESIKPHKEFSRQAITLKFYSEYFTFQYMATIAARQKICPNTVEYLRDSELGLRINHLKRGFCLPESGVSDEDYRNVFPSASLSGLSSPALLNVVLEFSNGLVGIGLKDYSNATKFEITNPYTGLMVDSLGGNCEFSSGKAYIGPQIVFTFPEDSWDSIKTFRKAILSAESMNDEKKQFTQKPQWWKRPMYCTYGDQIMQMHPALYTDKYWSSKKYTQQWVAKIVKTAEQRLGYKDFTVIIDTMWQKHGDSDPFADTKRFPDMRKLIDWLHSRGHKVLLWYAPLFTLKNLSFAKLAKKYSLQTNYEGILGVNYYDFSHKNAQKYLQEISERLFSSKSNCLNADGVKLDFAMCFAPAEKRVRFARPDAGMGFKAAAHFLEMFSGAARAVKPDVLLNYSASDPRVAKYFDMNRLHDTKITHLERERRARFSSLAIPSVLIDSDGAVMMSDWVEHTYISAAIYSTPSLYYIDKFNDGIKLPDSFMQSLGKLFELCSHRLWGIPEFKTYGSWQLKLPDKTIIGESYEGRLCWLLTQSGTIKAICLRQQELWIDLHGRLIDIIKPLPAKLVIEKDKAFAQWKAGVFYEIKTK